MPAPPYSALANWDGRLSQHRPSPSKPPPHSSPMPPPSHIPVNAASGRAVEPSSHQQMSSQSTPRHAGMPLQSSAVGSEGGDSDGWNVESAVVASQLSSFAPAYPTDGPSSRQSDTSFSSQPKSQPSTPQATMSIPLQTEQNQTHSIPLSPPSMLPAPSNTPFFLAFGDLVQHSRDYAKQQARPPSQLSMQSRRSSEDDDESVKQMLLVSRPSSPVQNKLGFDAPVRSAGESRSMEVDQDQENATVPSTSHEPPSPTSPATALQRPDRPSPLRIQTENLSDPAAMQLDSPKTSTSLFGFSMGMGSAEPLNELMYPPSSRSSMEIDAQAAMSAAAASSGNAAESSGAADSAKGAGGAQVQASTVDNSWEAWKRRVTAPMSLETETGSSGLAQVLAVETKSPEPSQVPSAESSSHAATSAETSTAQPQKMPLFLPETPQSQVASLPSTPPRSSSANAQSVAQQEHEQPPSPERSPSVEIIEPSEQYASTGESTLVDTTAAPQPALRRPSPSPAPSAGPSNPVPIRARPARGRRFVPDVTPISISSTSTSPSPGPASRPQPPRPGPPRHRAYIQLQELPPARRRLYRRLVTLPLPRAESESEEEPMRAGPSRLARAPVSPTVSDYGRAPAEVEREPDGDVVLLSREPSPAVVPSSVSPPARRRPRAQSPLFSPLSPTSPVAQRSQRTKSRAGTSRQAQSRRTQAARPRTPSPEVPLEEEQHWAADLSAVYNRMNAIAVAPSPEPVPKRKRKRANERASSSEPYEEPPKPRKRKRRGEGAQQPSPPSAQKLESRAAEPSTLTRLHRRPPPPRPPSTRAPSPELGPADYWRLSGLGEEAVDVLASLYVHYEPPEIDVSLDHFSPPEHDSDADGTQSALRSKLRHLFDAVGIDLGSDKPDRKGKARARDGSEEPLLQTTKFLAKKKGTIPRPSAPSDAPSTAHHSSVPVTPPRSAQAQTVMPSRPSVAPTKKAREERRKKVPPSPTPAEIVRQPAMPHVVPPQTPARPPSSSKASPSRARASPAPQHPAQPLSPQYTLPAPSDFHQQLAYPGFLPLQEAQAPQGLSYSYQPTYLQNGQVIPTNAVRQDAFFGAMNASPDDRMDIDMPGIYTDLSAQGTMFGPSSQWTDTSQSLQYPEDPPGSGFLGGTGPSMDVVGALPGATTPPLGVDPRVFAQDGGGTINPLLLGGPSTPPRSRSPTATPPPPSASSSIHARVSLAAVESGEELAPRASHAEPKPKARPGLPAAGKGKTRAADVGYRTRIAQTDDPVPGSYWAEEGLDAKRRRKPSTKAVEAGIAKPIDDTPPKLGKRTKTAYTAEEIEVINKTSSVVPYCHQCRNKNQYEKMRCTVLKESGEACGARYCQKCIELRYPEITFKAYAPIFKCPRCLNTCSCTQCCQRRGEEYVSIRGVKVDIAPSALYAEALRKERAAAASAAKAQSRRSTSAAVNSATTSSANARRSVSTATDSKHAPKAKIKPAPKKHAERTAEELELAARMALPQGAIWGTVYALNMDRIGIGVVADDATQKIVVTKPPGLGDPAYDFPAVGASIRAWNDTSDEDEGTPSPQADAHPSATLPARAASSAGVDAPPAIAPPPAPPARTRTGLFVGKLRTGWQRRPFSDRGIIRTKGVPKVHAYVGARAPIARAVRSAAAAQAALEEWACMSGPLTPEPSSDEGGGEGAAREAAPHESPLSRPPAGGASEGDMPFILARAIKAVSEPSDGGAVGEGPDGPPVAAEIGEAAASEPSDEDVRAAREIVAPIKVLAVQADEPMAVDKEDDGPGAASEASPGVDAGPAAGAPDHVPGAEPDTLALPGMADAPRETLALSTVGRASPPPAAPPDDAPRAIEDGAGATEPAAPPSSAAPAAPALLPQDDAPPAPSIVVHGPEDGDAAPRALPADTAPADAPGTRLSASLPAPPKPSAEYHEPSSAWSG